MQIICHGIMAVRNSVTTNKVNDTTALPTPPPYSLVNNDQMRSLILTVNLLIQDTALDRPLANQKSFFIESNLSPDF